MLENFELISSLGCCCGAEDVEAPTEQNTSVRLTEANNPTVSLSSQKSHPCGRCGPVLKEIFQLIGQQKTQPKQILLRCGACAKQFPFCATFYQHQEHHMREKPFLRSIDRISLVKGCNFNVSRKLFTCREVGQDMFTWLGHPQQQATHTSYGPNEILMSGVTFQRRNNNNIQKEYKAIGYKHMFVQGKGVHTGRQCFVCRECGKYFTKVSTFRYNQRVHTGERPDKCSECGKAFTRIDHPHSHHSVYSGERPYKRSECGKSFTRIHSLHCHQIVHTGERPYECQECGKSFTTSSALRYHQKFHTRKGPYEYNKCRKCFTGIQAFGNHQREYTGEEPYECSECRKAFTRIHHLYSHQGVNSGERPYEYSECGKSFTRIHSLHCHQIVHTEESPYECQECGKYFTTSSALRYHQKFHTRKRP
ncbi:zinc finger protein 211-like [Molossus molossus]|uniref:zinc finger protein 211-like n=1 Tax=Molossus molossus TaxID=27622 RepID=UPI0017479A67|nr:zinc finger protein 211-like [Molossus molossus]